MKTKYLSSLEKLYKNQKWTMDDGVPEKDIRSLENKIGFSFPKAYREFLLLDGNWCPVIKVGFQFDYIEEINNDAQAYFKEYNINLERDIWVVGEVDASMYIVFFFLDEGDNPPIYRFDFHHFDNIRQYKYDMETYGRPIESDEIDEDYEYLMKLHDSFSSYIDAKIDMYDPDLEE